LQVDHCVELETWPLSRRFDHPKDYTYYSGIDDVGQIGRLVDGASDDVVVGYGCGLRGIVPVLFTDDIEDRLRDVQQDILQADHVAGIGKGGLVSTEDFEFPAKFYKLFTEMEQKTFLLFNYNYTKAILDRQIWVNLILILIF